MTTKILSDEEKYMTTNNLGGEYNWQDPIYLLLKRETASPRFKIFLLKEQIYNQTFYQFCDACALHPYNKENLDELFREARNECVRRNITTLANEEMKEQLSTTNKPYTDKKNTLWCG